MERGQILDGRYRLLERVGAGGMGEVWRAVDLELSRDVAIKCLHPWGDRRDLEAARQQLRHEATAMAQLDNPHIVKVHDIFDHEGTPCLTMEYVRGRNLRDVLEASDTPDSGGASNADGGSLPPQRVAEIGAQLADALRAVHEKDVVHGDVKPGNVLIDEHGTAKLTDFGIARRLNANSTMTVAGALRGTPGYVAPEVANGAKITPESDMFGLGATLFAAVERVSPYGEGDGWELVRRAQAYGVDGEPLRPFHGPRSLAVVVLRLLARNPGRRPSAPLACRAFEALGDVSEPAPLPLPREPLPVRIADLLHPWRRTAVRHRRAVTATVTAVTVVFAAAVLTLSLDRHPGHGATGADSLVDTPAASAVPTAIGDPRTVDPCALTDASALGRYGQAQTDANYGGFDRCDVLVQTAAGAQVDVEAQFQAPGDLAGAPSPSPDTTGSPGTVNVARPPGQSDECDRFLYLTGGYGVVVSAETDDGQSDVSSADLCAMADTATASAVTALDHGPLRRRNAAGSSLVHADACRLLNASALAAVPGTNAAERQAGFGDFSCQWSSPSSGTSVSLRFDQNDPLDGTDGTLMRLGGRQAYVQPGGDSSDTSNCLAQVVYRDFSGADGPTEELLYLVVDGSQGFSSKANIALCHQATSLAAAASTALTGE